MSHKKISVPLSESQLAALKILAAMRGQGVSETVRKLLDEQFTANGIDFEPLAARGTWLKENNPRKGGDDNADA